MGRDTVNWIRLDKSGIAVHVPCKVWGFIFHPSVAAGYGSVYDGLDATSGREFLQMRSAALESRPYLFGKPVLLERGVFIYFESNVECVTVLWEPDD